APSYQYYDPATGINKVVPMGEGLCASSPPPMDSTAGASRYYSSENDLAASGNHQYIPRAHGFPFTETRYSPDNTGRVTAQSGVGLASMNYDAAQTSTYYQMRNQSRYYYGVPHQQELDALFGTEAGDASHYQKNMVRDANGQYSVSYVDMHGRTVATALAG